MLLFQNSQDSGPERPKTGMGMRPRTGRRSARPPSARPAPPRVREKKEVSEDEVTRYMQYFFKKKSVCILYISILFLMRLYLYTSGRNLISTSHTKTKLA